MELPDIPALVKRLGGRERRSDEGAYPEVPGRAGPGELRALGEEYLERTRIHRKTDKPFFIDKLPNNWAHVGLIHLILPKAKIVDARRHPLDCCFSNFRQHYARGQGFSYSLADMGRYYADYVAADGPFRPGAAGPGPPGHPRAADRAIPSAEIRALLDALGLPFDPACLALPREQARRPHRQLRAGPPPDQPRGHGPVAAVRAAGSGR